MHVCTQSHIAFFLCACAEQKRLDHQMEELKREEKRMVGLLADKGAGPQNLGPAMINAMLKLRDKKGGGSDGDS